MTIGVVFIAIAIAVLQASNGVRSQFHPSPQYHLLCSLLFDVYQCRPTSRCALLTFNRLYSPGQLTFPGRCNACETQVLEISVEYRSVVHSSRDRRACEMLKILEVKEVQPLIDSAIDYLITHVDYDTILKKYLNFIGNFVLCGVSDEKPSVQFPLFASVHTVCDILMLGDPDTHL